MGNMKKKVKDFWDGLAKGEIGVYILAWSLVGGLVLGLIASLVINVILVM